jgi:hypothetical protein
VDHHSGGLVDDGQVLILMQDVEENVFWEGVERRRVGRPFDLNLLPSQQLQLRLWRLAVDAYLTVFDQKLYTGTTNIRDSLRKILIEAEASGLRRSGKGVDPLF